MTTHPQTLILVAIGESPVSGYPHPSISSRRAFEWTIEKITRGTTSHFKILFIHVQPPEKNDEDPNFVYVYPVQPLNARLSFHKLEKGLQMLGFFVHKCRIYGIKAEAIMRKGDPAKVICDVVKRVNPDFLVMGSNSVSFLERLFTIFSCLSCGTSRAHGSCRLFRRNVSKFCVKYAACPVMVIQCTDEETRWDLIDYQTPQSPTDNINELATSSATQ